MPSLALSDIFIGGKVSRGGYKQQKINQSINLLHIKICLAKTTRGTKDLDDTSLFYLLTIFDFDFLIKIVFI